MGNRQDLIAAAKAKHTRDQLISAAKAKYAADNQSSMPTAEDVAQLGRSAVEGVTMGISEPIFSGINATTQQIYDAATQSKDPVEFASKLVDLKKLGENYDADVNRRRKYEAENPLKTQTAEMVGNVVPALMTGGESQVAKILSTPATAINEVGVAAKQAVNKIPLATKALESSKLGGSAARMIESGTSAAAQAVAQEGLKRSIEKPTGFIQDQDNLPSMAEVAVTGGGMGAGMQAVPEIARQAGKLAKGAAKIFTGVKPEDIDAYMANPERIRAAKSVEQVKDEIDATIGKLREDVESAKISKADAKEVLKEAESKLNQHVAENKQLISQQKADIRYAFNAAKSNLNQAFKEATETIKNTRPPIRSDDIMDSVEQVKDRVSDLSRESYEVLGQYEGKFALEGVDKQIARLQDNLKTGGQILSKDSQAAFNELGQWRKKLSKYDKTELSGKEIKQIIQEIDSDLREYSDRMKGTFSDKSYNALMGVRQSLDRLIKKNVPGYSEAMEQVVKMNDIRAQMAKLFGKRENIVSKLSRIESPSMDYERKALRELGQVTGKDFTTPLQEYIENKMLTKSNLGADRLKESLPEFDRYIDTMRADARAKRPEFGLAQLDKARNASPEALAVKKAQGALTEAEAALNTANGELDPFKRITPQNSENVIRTLMGDKTRKIELKRLMSGLSQVSDQDFMQIIDDMRIKGQFEKGFVNGSSNVNLWAILSGVFGLVSGDPTFGVASAGAGGAFGKFMDSHGPKITKRVLDGMIYMRGTPTVQKINAAFADLPEGVRQQLKTDLVRLVTAGNSTGQIVVAPDQRMDLATDLQQSDTLNNLEKAKAITQMNKTGAIDSAVMQKMMIGEEKAEPVQPIRAAPEQTKSNYNLKNVTDYIQNKKPEAY